MTSTGLPSLFPVGRYTVALTSFDFLNGTGTGTADIYASVPEPATWIFSLAGCALLAVAAFTRLGQHANLVR